MNKDLIIVKQLPQIEEHLKELSVEIEEKVENAKNLVCTEESVKTIKQVRADLNKEFKELEVQRKTVKEQILAPYMQFEEVYKTYISEKYKSADIDLKQKIDNVEDELKEQKEQEIKDYFEEYKVANNIDFVNYEQAKINVTLTASKKSLKEQAKVFIDKIIDDLKLIETQECKDEILVEYKQNLNVSRAIQEVANRHKLLEEERKRQEKWKKTEQVIIDSAKKSDKYAEEVEVLQSPVEELQDQEDILTLKFTVKGTRTKLRELKQFLENGGYDYE